MLEESPAAITDTAAAAELLAQEARQQLDRVLPSADSAAGKFLSRVQWLAAAMPDLKLPSLDRAELEPLFTRACYGLRSLDELRSADWLSLLQNHVGYDRLAEIERLAPAEIELPSGNRHAIAYEAGKPPLLAVRIQELFGMGETPRIAGGRVPLLLHLLGPNYRPQQVTADLASFWRTAIRKLRRSCGVATRSISGLTTRSQPRRRGGG